MDEHIYYTHSSKETEELGMKIAHDFNPGMVIFLYGDLGVGKTTFVKGIAKQLGVTSRIISPTFVIIREHEVKVKTQKSKVKNTSENLKVLYHIDLYRLENKKQIEEIGLQEILQDKEAITLIEWPEMIEKNVKKNLSIRFEDIDEDKRKIVISHNSSIV